MSAGTLNLKLWSNFIPKKLGQKANIGDAWVIDPDGSIVEPTEHINATDSPGILKIYRGVHPDCLVIHRLFPNAYVGHVLWISQAPLQLTKAQIETVRRTEQRLAKNWEYTARWEFIMCTPPPVNISLGPREIYASQQSSHGLSRSRSRSCP